MLFLGLSIVKLVALTFVCIVLVVIILDRQWR